MKYRSNSLIEYGQIGCRIYNQSVRFIGKIKNGQRNSSSLSGEHLQ